MKNSEEYDKKRLKKTVWAVLFQNIHVFYQLKNDEKQTSQKRHLCPHPHPHPILTSKVFVCQFFVRIRTKREFYAK